MSIPCDGPDFTCGENQSALCNTAMPESALKKKCQSIVCYLIREGAVRDEKRTACFNTNKNETDILTKILPSGEKRKGFVERALHFIFRSDECSVPQW